MNPAKTLRLATAASFLLLTACFGPAPGQGVAAKVGFHAGTYRLDLDASQERLRRMGYTNFAAQSTRGVDGSFVSSDLPACCVHDWDESATHWESRSCSGSRSSTATSTISSSPGRRN